MYSQIITAGRLQALLNELPADFMLCMNIAGNIMIRDAVDNYHGYIDLNAEVIHVAEEAY